MLNKLISQNNQLK